MTVYSSSPSWIVSRCRSGPSAATRRVWVPDASSSSLASASWPPGSGPGLAQQVAEAGERGQAQVRADLQRPGHLLDVGCGDLLDEFLCRDLRQVGVAGRGQRGDEPDRRRRDPRHRDRDRVPRHPPACGRGGRGRSADAVVRFHVGYLRGVVCPSDQSHTPESVSPRDQLGIPLRDDALSGSPHPAPPDPRPHPGGTRERAPAAPASASRRHPHPRPGVTRERAPAAPHRIRVRAQAGRRRTTADALRHGTPPPTRHPPPDAAPRT